jgi:uncharacterized membrane protein YhaH (DUF805 family)
MIVRALGYNLSRLFVFTGRETRRLFWPYAIAVFLAGCIVDLLLFVPVMMQMMNRIMAYAQQHPGGLPRPAPGQVPALPPELMPDLGQVMVPMAVVGLVTLLLYAAATVRRLHDRDRAGWWALLPLPFQAIGLALAPAAFDAMLHPGAQASPLLALSSLNSLGFWAALIVLIVLLANEGTPGPNRFGEALGD